MQYPDIVRDPPDSLVLAREFVVAGSPSDFFPPPGLAIILAGAASVVLAWRVRGTLEPRAERVATGRAA